MKEQIDILIKLQKIETEIGNIKAAFSQVSAKLDMQEVRLAEFGKAIETEAATADQLKKDYRSCEAGVRDNISLIKKKEETLRSIKTNQEYQALLKEIEGLKKKNSQIEDEMLAYLSRIEEAEKNIAAKKDELSNLNRELGKEKEKTEKESESGKRKLDELDFERNAVVKGADTNLLKRFMMLKDLKGGLGIAPVISAVCQGCNMNIPPQMYNDLYRCDSVKICPHCQRIIYWGGVRGEG